MLNLKEENKELCFADSTLKPLKLYLYSWVENLEHANGGYWSFFTVLENSLMLESADNTEGVLDGNQFTLGSFVKPEINVSWQNDGIRYRDCACVPVQQIGDEYIAYFFGEITQEKVSKDGTYVSATIEPKIDLSQNVYRSILGTSGTLSNIIYNVLYDCGIYFDSIELSSNFANADIEFGEFLYTDLDEETSLEDFLKKCAEFLGAHIKLSTKKIVTEYTLKADWSNTENVAIEFVRIPGVTSDFSPNLIEDERFAKLDYIQSTGRQYIDTYFYANQNTRVIIDFALEKIEDCFLFGSRKSKYENAYNISINGADQTINSFYGTKGIKIGNIDTERHLLDKNKNKIYIDGELLHEEVIQTFSSNLGLEIFSCNDGTNGSGYKPCKAKIYSVKIFDNDELVRDFVPCEDLQDGFTGLYDLVEQEFFISSSQNDFIGNRTPPNYTLPYYISVTYDKYYPVYYTGIILIVKDGENEKHYAEQRVSLATKKVGKNYEISNNFLFQKLGESERVYAFKDVCEYIYGLNYYNCELQYTYAPFIEPCDVIILKNILTPGQFLLPDGYLPLQYIDYSTQLSSTYIYPSGSDIEIEIKFELLENNVCDIFKSDSEYTDKTLSLRYINNKLVAYVGRWQGTNTDNGFTIDNVPINQPISLKISLKNGELTYEGSYNGVGTYSVGNPDASAPLRIGDDNQAYRLYSFSYFENGEQLLDLRPSVQEESDKTGLYDTVGNEFYLVNTQYAVLENVIIPVLNSYAVGIHSMRADIVINSANSDK